MHKTFFWVGVRDSHELIFCYKRCQSSAVGVSSLYGVRSRRTRLLEDQLGRADAGSWQIADRYTMAS